MSDSAGNSGESLAAPLCGRWRWARAVGLRIACRRWAERLGQRVSRGYERLAAQTGMLAVTPTRLRLRCDVDEFITAPRPALLLAGHELDDVAAYLKARHPAHVDDSVRRAGEIINGRYDVLGYGPLDFGSPIDWSLDPVGKHSFPHQYWRNYDVMRPPPGADVKVPWELSRCHFLVALGQAYRLTTDERYARRAAELLEAWLLDNPPAMTINWACPMDAAIRAANWCFAWQLLEKSALLTKPLRVRWLCAMVDHGLFLERNPERTDFWDESFTYRRCNNNHYLAGLLGRLVLAVFWPEVNALARGMKWICDELQAEIECQILEDGLNWERAAGYQKLDVEILLTVFVLCARAGHPWPQRARDRLLKACEALSGMTRPDGLLHLFGDHDDGHILDFGDPPPDSALAMLAWGANALGTPTLLAENREPCPASVAWRTGVAAFERLCALQSSPPPTARTPRVYAGGSYASLRCGDSFVGMPLGGVGMLGHSGHAHNDALAVEVVLHERPIFTDAGAYVYTADPTEHNRHRATRAHTTIVIDGEEQNPFPADLALIFAYDADLAKPCLLHVRDGVVHEGRECTEAAAKTEAYARLGVDIQRTVCLADDGSSVVIEDTLTAKSPRAVEFRFLLEPGLQPSIDADGVHIAGAQSGQAVALLSATADTSGLQWETERCFRSRRYGQREPAWMLVGRTRVESELKVCFVVSCSAQEGAS